MDSLKKFSLSVVLGVMISIFSALPVASADSLWMDAGPAANLYADHKARAVGDIVTIIINESSNAVRVGKADNSKSSSISGDAGVGIFSWMTQASAKSSDSFQAQGSISNTNTVTAKITTTVIDVKPNGNLVISGTQTIKQNGEQQKITVTGVVRPDDITADNTVLSTYVADAQILIDGNGPIANKQRQGILSQIFNFLF